MEALSLEDAEELFEIAQGLIVDVSNALDGNFQQRLSRAISMSNVEVCAIRVHADSTSNQTFHVLSECFKFVEDKQNPGAPSEVPTRSYQKAGNLFGSESKTTKLRRHAFFTMTYEHTFNNQHFHVSLSFTSKDYAFMTQPVGCFNCSDENFCSQQPAEQSEWNSEDPSEEIVEIMEIFTSMWTPVLAEFSQSFGIEFMYDEVAYILNQVYDSWDDIPRELEPSYEEYRVNQKGELKKDSNLCSKDECTDSADYGGLCFLHEDLCRVTDCFDVKERGAYCEYHSQG